MFTFSDARNAIVARCRPLDGEEVRVDESLGRILVDDLAAPVDLPMWASSAMDGYALDSATVRVGQPIPVDGFIPAGRPHRGAVPPGTAAKILTGAALPMGADCVVPFEEVDADGATIRLSAPPVAGAHIRAQGSDLARGDIALIAGTQIGFPEIALLAGLNQPTVRVRRRPIVAILSTGDELLPVGDVLVDGSIVDSNGPALAAATREVGAVPRPLGVVADDVAALTEALREGLSADVLVTSAGVSTGDRDLVRAALDELGVEEVFWKVAIQPGRPVAFARAGDCLVFCLPGNPVAALLTFSLLVRPALRRMLGHRRPVEVSQRAALGEEVYPRPDRMTLRRVRLERTGAGLVAVSSGPQATGQLHTLARADGIALIPAGDEPLPAGTLVDVHPLRPEPEFLGGTSE